VVAATLDAIATLGFLAASAVHLSGIKHIPLANAEKCLKVSAGVAQ
jgi:hypothetical protein